MFSSGVLGNTLEIDFIVFSFYEPRDEKGPGKAYLEAPFLVFISSKKSKHKRVRSRRACPSPTPTPLGSSRHRRVLALCSRFARARPRELRGRPVRGTPARRRCQSRLSCSTPCSSNAALLEPNENGAKITPPRRAGAAASRRLRVDSVSISRLIDAYRPWCVSAGEFEFAGRPVGRHRRERVTVSA